MTMEGSRMATADQTNAAEEAVTRIIDDISSRDPLSWAWFETTLDGQK
jgi:hypothetical protein